MCLYSARKKGNVFERDVFFANVLVRQKVEGPICRGDKLGLGSGRSPSVNLN